MPNLIALVAAAVPLAFPPQVSCDQSDPVSVAMVPLEVLGEASPDFADALSQKLKHAIEVDPRFKVVSGAGARYQIKGHIFTEPQRRFVGLQLIDTVTGATVWSENFDYTNITAEMMAEHLGRAISTASVSTTQP